MPAVHGADIAYVEKHPVGIPVGQAFNRTVLVFSKRILEFKIVNGKFVYTTEGQGPCENYPY
jgi:hypothetical protein